MKEQDYPLVSVIMPAYNTEKYISEAINSILNQTYKNFELFIIDDCSTDRTVEIIKAYVDARIRFIYNEKNYGLVYSLNKCINLAKGKYIARMDSDDISLPERLCEQVEYMELKPDVSIIGTAFRYSDSKEVVQHPEGDDLIKIQLLNNTAFGHPTVMIRKNDLINNYLVYDHSFLPAEDYELWTRMAEKGLKMANLSTIGLIYRRHNSQISSSRHDEQSMLTENIRRKHRSFYFGKILDSEEIGYIGNFSLSINKSINFVYKLWSENISKNYFNRSFFNKYLSLYLIQRLNKYELKNSMFNKKFNISFKIWLLKVYFNQISHNIRKS